MTTFKDIQKAYGDFSRARDTYWEDLYQKVGLIYEGFTEHLEFEKPMFIDMAGRKRPYLELGQSDDLDGFQVLRPGDLEYDPATNTLDFSFSLWLDDGVASYPSEAVHVDLTIAKIDGKYQVAIHEGGEPIKSAIGSATGAADLERLYETITSRILAQLKR